MRWIRDFLCGLALTALTAVSVWAAVTVAREFPGPSAPAPIDVRQWLTQRDLSQASNAERSRVTRQLEQELSSGKDLAAEMRALGGRERELLQENLMLLLEHWFRTKADTYAALRPNRREKWLDEQIAQIERMAVRGREPGNSPLGLPGSLYALGMINNQVEQWIERAEPPRRQEAMREFWRAFQARAMTRQHPKRPRNR